MDRETIERLLALNRAFYAAFARPFAASRPVSDPALVCILPYIPARASVLDVGCGNGRLAFLLDRERPGTTYLGVDAVPELVELARAQAAHLAAISAEFRVADVARPGWGERLGGGKEGREGKGGKEGKEGRGGREGKKGREGKEGRERREGFDCAVALAVLHHIPSFDLRAQVLGEIASLLKSGGLLILSTWQFLDSPRMRRKIVDWAEAGVPREALEPGDYLLDWKREGRGLRYCHLVDEAEVERLAVANGFCVRKTSRAGGREGDLSLFAILDKSGVGHRL